MDQSGKWRGRFIVNRDMDGGWLVLDDLEGLIIETATKAGALDLAQFARAYVRRWGCIDFASFPYILDQPPSVGYPAVGGR